MKRYYEYSEGFAQPVRLFRFTYGENAADNYYYTNADAQVSFDGMTFNPISIEHSRIEGGTGIDGKTVTITVPIDSEIAGLFASYPPSTVVSVTIWDGMVPNDPAGDGGEFESGLLFGVIYRGRILQSEREQVAAKFSCEATTAGMRRPGLRRNYQWACPLALYGTRCGASKAAVEQTSTVAAVSGPTVTLASGWEGSISPEKFVGGLIEWDIATGTVSRGVIRQNGDVLTLSGLALDLSVSDSVRVYPGCARSLTDCETLHNNVQNFGGQPWIPTDNPVGKNNHL